MANVPKEKAKRDLVCQLFPNRDTETLVRGDAVLAKRMPEVDEESRFLIVAELDQCSRGPWACANSLIPAWGLRRTEEQKRAGEYLGADLKQEPLADIVECVRNYVHNHPPPSPEACAGNGQQEAAAKPAKDESRVSTLLATVRQFLGMPDGAKHAAKSIARTFRDWNIPSYPADFEPQLATWAADPAHVHHVEDMSRKPHEWRALRNREAEALLEQACLLTGDSELKGTLDAYRERQQENETRRRQGWPKPASLDEAVGEAMKWAQRAALLSTDPSKNAAFESIKLGLRVLRGDRPRSRSEVTTDHEGRIAAVRREAIATEEAFHRGEATADAAGAAWGRVRDLERVLPTEDLMPTGHLAALAAAIEDRQGPLDEDASHDTETRMRILAELVQRVVCDLHGTAYEAASPTDTPPKRVVGEARSDLFQLATRLHSQIQQLPGFKSLSIDHCVEALRKHTHRRHPVPKGRLSTTGVAAWLARAAGALGLDRATQQQATRAIDNAMMRRVGRKGAVPETGKARRSTKSGTP